jgi:hypothetical protein
VTEFENELMDRLQTIADQKFGGHLTILKFTTNWRICFGSPEGGGSLERHSEDAGWP